MRTVLAYLAAVFVTFVAASASHSHFTLMSLADAGAAIPLELRLQTIFEDMQGLAVGYGSIIAVALLAAFLIAWRVRRIIRIPTALTYSVAGAAAMGTTLSLIPLYLGGLQLIGGARSDAGFAAQCIAGGLGGLLFAILTPGESKARA